MKNQRPQRFTAEYWSQWGIYVIMADTFVTFIRMSDGMCNSWSYRQLGFREKEDNQLTLW